MIMDGTAINVFSTHDVIITIALFFIAMAISGFTALAIFWPLTKVHLRDRHPNWRDEHLQKSNEWLWFFTGRFSRVGDPNLNGLARPLQISLWVIMTGLLGAWFLWLMSEYVFK